jgi:cytochrome c-type protein NapB
VDVLSGRHEVRTVRRAEPLIALCMLLAACGPSADGVPPPGPRDGSTKSTSAVRATRRLYDGSPPVIPHARIGADCVACHNERGMEVADLGFAPPSPHALTAGMSAMSRCEQCHVFCQTNELFGPSEFTGLAQDLRAGTRLYGGAPPVIPHAIQMRENCAACHSGPAAREEIRCTHPERARCQQCHVPAVSPAEFRRL